MTSNQIKIWAKVVELRQTWKQVMKSTVLGKNQVADFKKVVEDLEAMPEYSEELMQGIMERVAEKKLKNVR